MADWLPGLCRLEDFNGDWQRYEDELYRYFRRDFIVSRPAIDGQPVGINVAPVVNGKEESFWHLTTEEQEVVQDGVARKERLPDMKRCCRIRWPRAILDAARSADVRAWRERRPDGLRLVFALGDFSYLVSVAVRGSGKLFLATAFPIVYERRREKHRKQYERYMRERRS